MDNWLAKLASEQTVNDVNMDQAVDALTPEELQAYAEEQAPLAPNLDNLQQKIAEADELGRSMAREQGPGLAAQAEQQAMQTQAYAQLVNELPDDEVIKLAYVMENGSEEEKVAFWGSLASGGAKLLQGARGVAGKAMTSKPGTWLYRQAVKNPLAATTVGGAAVGGVGAAATGGDVGKGMALGGLAGLGGGALAGRGAVQGGLKSMYRAGARNAGMTSRAATRGSQASLIAGRGASRAGALPNVSLPRANMFKGASPLTKAARAIAHNAFVKAAYDQKNEWLEQFEGTPMLEQALDLARKEIELEQADIQRRMERRQEQDSSDTWDQRDMLSNQKKMLELELISQRNGAGAQEEEPQEEMPQEEEQYAEEPQEEQALEQAQEQVKEAYAQALGFAKTAKDSYEETRREERKRMARGAGRLMGATTGLSGLATGGPVGALVGVPVGYAMGYGGGRLGGKLMSMAGGSPNREKGKSKEEVQRGERKRISRGVGRVGGTLGALAGTVGGIAAGDDLARGARRLPARLGGGVAGGLLGGALGYGLGYAGERLGGKITSTLGGEKAMKYEPKLASAQSSIAKKLLTGAALVGGGAAAGGAVGHKKGKKKGRKEGFRVGTGYGYGVGARRGYRAGVRRGYQIGRSGIQKKASFR